MTHLPNLILRNLIQRESFCRKALPHIKAEYFEGTDRVVYELILSFITKYNKLPNSAAIQIEFEQKGENQHKSNEILETIKTLSKEDDSQEEWLLDSTEKWCKNRALLLGIIESYQIIDGKSKDKSEGAIVDIMTKALSVTFDTNVGHDYIENADSRYAFYHEHEERMPFDLEMFNTITRGGVPNKTLNIILAGTGVGKSLMMCHFAAAALSASKNVLYITMEMAEERIAERIDANLFDISLDQLGNVSKEIFDSKISKIQTKTNGKLVIKEYPTGSAHVGHFRALLNELKMKKDFKPDLIFIDYLNICSSSRIRGLGGSINTYSFVKAIAEEIRGLAVEFDVPIWSATQLNREGYKSSDVDLTDTSESFGLPATADFMIAAINNEKLEASGQLLIKQLKNRYNDPSANKRFTVGVDRDHMRLFDVEDATADLVNDTTAAPVASTPFSVGSRADFSDFKV